MYLTRLNPLKLFTKVKWSMVLLLWLGLQTTSYAVFVFSSFQTTRSMTMRVGSANSTIDRVTINVPGASIQPVATPVEGTSNGPTTTPIGGVEVRASAGYTNNTNTSLTNGLRLTVDSSVALTCVAGSGCGTNVMPFSAIGWTSYNHDTNYPTYDIQDGQFNNGTAQTLVSVTVSGASVYVSNILVFKYNTNTIYPAGQYTGRVTYTATIP